MQANAVEVLKDRKMVLFQYAVVLFCVVSNISDGFDSLSMAFVAPVITREWQVDPKYMGIVFAAASFGLVLGSLFIAPLADRFGRRPIIVIASGTAALSMLIAAVSQSVTELAIGRLLIGMSIGTLIPSLNVMVAEYSNEKLGNLFLALLHVGFAIGAITCSVVAIYLLDWVGWRSVFLTAAALSGGLFLLALFFLPESLDYLLSRQPKNALERANRLLAKLRVPLLDTLPQRADSVDGQRMNAGRLLTPLLFVPTMLLWLAAASHYFVSYFKTNWTPSILVESGLDQSTAISSGIVMGVTAAAGNIVMGLLAHRVGVYRLTMGAYAMGTLALLLFGFIAADPILLLMAAGLVSFFIQATFTGTIIGATRFYSPDIRSTGVGLIVGLGRMGGIAGPVVAGVLISLGWDRSAYYPLFALICSLGAVAMFFLHRIVTVRRAQGNPIG